MTFQEKLKQMNKDLAKGILPDDLNFSLPPPNKKEQEIIDEICQIAFYKDFNYYAKRYPFYESLAGFENIIQNIVTNNSNTTPEEEINYKLTVRDDRENISNTPE
jgi:hypothetical protein